MESMATRQFFTHAVFKQALLPSNDEYFRSLHVQMIIDNFETHYEDQSLALF